MIKAAAGIFVKESAWFRGTRLFTPRQPLGFVDRSIRGIEDKPTIQQLSKYQPEPARQALEHEQTRLINTLGDKDYGGLAQHGTGNAFIRAGTQVEPGSQVRNSIGQKVRRSGNRRLVIAHEAFHAGPLKAPWYRRIAGGDMLEKRIRGNEFLAYAVGGFRGAPKGSNLLQRLYSAGSEVGRYGRYRYNQLGV